MGTGERSREGSEIQDVLQWSHGKPEVFSKGVSEEIQRLSRGVSEEIQNDPKPGRQLDPLIAEALQLEPPSPGTQQLKDGKMRGVLTPAHDSVTHTFRATRFPLPAGSWKRIFTAWKHLPPSFS